MILAAASTCSRSKTSSDPNSPAEPERAASKRQGGNRDGRCTATDGSELFRNVAPGVSQGSGRRGQKVEIGAKGPNQKGGDDDETEEENENEVTLLLSIST
jgi:hypothetical protein